MVALDLVVRAEILSIARRHPKLSHRKIASMVGVTHNTVAHWAAQVQGHVFPCRTDTGLAGRSWCPLLWPDFLEEQLLGPGASSTVELANLVFSRLKVFSQPTNHL